MEPRSPRFPHMSLHYIDDSEPDQRQMLADELLSSGRVEKEGDRMILHCFADNQTVSRKFSGFDGEEIWIVRCESAVEQWEVLEKVVLARS